MFDKIWRTLLHVLPYMASGFAAPFIFRAASTPQRGGHFAGALFLFAGIWAVGLSFKHEYPVWARALAISILVMNVFFWSWRFVNATPLREATLLGINGGAWHGTLTTLYLALLVVLMAYEFRLVNRAP